MQGTADLCLTSKERGYHIVSGIFIALIGLIITMNIPTSGGKYAGLCILLFGSYVSAPLTVAWLSGNTPGTCPRITYICVHLLNPNLEPGKRSLVLGANGFGNLAGVIGSQIYKRKYAPRYMLPFYVTLGFVAVAFLGYVAYRLTLQAVNRRKLTILAGKSAEEIRAERVDDARYADRKWTFLYGL